MYCFICKVSVLCGAVYANGFHGGAYQPLSKVTSPSWKLCESCSTTVSTEQKSCAGTYLHERTANPARWVNTIIALL